MQRSHKIRLVPNSTQLTALRKAAGTARFTYNWGLDAWNKQYEEYKAGKAEKPTAYSLSRRWTKERPEWTEEVYRGLQTKAILNLGNAWLKYWNKQNAKPAFKKKGGRDSFYVGNDKPRLFGSRISLPLIGKVKLREELRFQGRPLSYTVSYEAGQWYVSVMVELDKPIEFSKSKSVVGVDVGIRNIAVASDNTVLINPKNLAKKQRCLKRLQRKLARQTKGSKRRAQTKLRIAKINKRIVNQRVDSIHKFTAALAKNHGIAVIETLDVKEMLSQDKSWPNRLLQDTAMKEVHRQLEYKMRETVKAPKFYPSSKTCSECGDVKASLPPDIRVYKCSCGASLDRDKNAACNLRNMRWVTASKCVEPPKEATKRKAKTARKG